MENDQFEIRDLVPYDAPINGVNHRFICISLFVDGDKKIYAVSNGCVDAYGELVPSSGTAYIPDTVAKAFADSFCRLLREEGSEGGAKDPL